MQANFSTITVDGNPSNTNGSNCFFIQFSFNNAIGDGTTAPGQGGNNPVVFQYIDTVWGPSYPPPPSHSGYGVIQRSDTMCSGTKFRYQLPCTHLPDVIRYSSLANGVNAAINLGSGSNLPPDPLIDNFTDAIADSLLPYHPEYCKLLLCDDHLEDILQKITTYKDAQALGLSTIQQIFNQDPIHVSGTNPNGLTFQELSHLNIVNPSSSQPSTSVSYLFQRIDTLAIEKAYCGCDAPESYAYCRNIEYRNEIKNMGTSLLTADTQIQNAYIRNLIAFYISNRTIRLQKRMDGPATCGPCADNRMNLIAPPIFQQFFNGNTVSSSFASPPGLPADVQAAINQALAGNAQNGLPATVGSATGTMATNDAENIKMQVKAILTSLQNCGLTTQDSTALSVYLRDPAVAGINGSKITPAVVKAKLQALNYNINNLCNAFLVKYNTFDATANKSSSNFTNKSPAFYNGLTSFLARSGITAALNTINPTSGGGGIATFQLDATNKFENELAAVLQTTPGGTITAIAYLKTVNDPASLPADNTNSTTRTYYTLVLSNGNYKDTLYFTKRMGVAQSDCNPTATNPNVSIVGAAYANTFSFSNIRTVLNDVASYSLADGYIADNLVYANLNGLAGTTNQASCDNYVIWGRSISMLNPRNPEALDDCINCVQIKNGVQDYFTDATAEGLPTFTNDAYFSTCITNYLNYKLKQNHNYFDYESLMKGCALSDFPQFKFRQSPGQYHRMFNSQAALDDYISTVNNTIGNGNIDYFSYLDNWGNYHIWVKLNSAPVNKYRAIAQLMPPGTTEDVNSNFVLDVIMPQNSCNGTAPQFPIPPGCYLAFVDNIKLKNITGVYDIPMISYTILGADNLDEKSIANAISSLKAYSLANCSGISFVEARKVMRSTDYDSVAKTNYLNYIYGLEAQGQSQSDIANNIAPGILKGNTGIQPFTNSSLVSYSNPWCSGSKDNLYYAKTPNYINVGWNRLQTIVLSVSSSVGLGNGVLFPVNNITTINNSSYGLPFKVIKMADGTAWYRVFDTENKLYNIYISPAPNMAAASSTYKMVGGIEPIIGPDSIYRFKVTMQNTSLSNAPIPHNVTCYGYTDFGLGGTSLLQNVVLSKDDTPTCLDTLPCEKLTLITAIQQGKALYAAYMDSIKQYHYLSMKEFFPANTIDTLDFNTIKQQYQYTLYNYDLAGNLTSTIPPMGVNPMASTAGVDNARNTNNTNTQYQPTHTKKSEYWYNSFNQLIKQQTPDGGITTFLYDKTGRLVFSQNAKQKPASKYSYTLYDEQGRINETGVIVSPSVPNQVNPLIDNVATNDMAYIAPAVRTKAREDVVATYYDEPLLTLATSNAALNNQENLRKRVSSILYIPQLAVNKAAASYYSYATHFSYDALGNVKTLVQDNPYMDYLGQRFKRIDYDYDLLSGKVNLVSYNRGKADQFYQKYSYDADNRITKVESSNNGLNWDRDADYTYYKHGPLAQMNIGDLNVQSVQYAYTIQGWLKSINGDVLDPATDMGKDGTSASGSSNLPISSIKEL